ncbi:uncharacterized mitochondrial protein-like protein [Tanacetum coccineum]
MIYDTWAMEMEHYLEYIDNEVWKVIQNGNSKKRVTKGKDGVYRILPPTTQAEQVADEKERKQTLLLMAVPKDHLRRFHGMDDAKEIWAAIKTRFGGNANSKKMQKAVLKQQFEAFTISSKDKHKATSTQENSSYTTSSSKATPTATPGLADEVIHSFLATNADDVDLIHEDLDQIDDLDLEEMDINWQIAMTAIKSKGRSASLKVNRWKQAGSSRGQDFKANSGRLHVSSGTHIKSGTSSFNTGKQHVSSGSMISTEAYGLRGIFDSGCWAQWTGNRAHLKIICRIKQSGICTFEEDLIEAARTMLVDHSCYTLWEKQFNMLAIPSTKLCTGLMKHLDQYYKTLQYDNVNTGSGNLNTGFMIILGRCLTNPPEDSQCSSSKSNPWMSHNTLVQTRSSLKKITEIHCSMTEALKMEAGWKSLCLTTPGFVDPDHPTKVYKVVKALYGLHQAPRAWYATLSTFLEKHGYKRGTIDKTLFIRRNKKDIMLVQVRFQMSSMGELTFFLGLQVKQNKDGKSSFSGQVVATCFKKFDLRCLFISQVLQDFSSLCCIRALQSTSSANPTWDFWKSTSGGLSISWSKKYLMAMQEKTIVATSTTEAEFVAAAHCCGTSVVNPGSLGEVILVNPQPSADSNNHLSLLPATHHSCINTTNHLPTVTHSVQPPPQPSSVQPTAITPPTQPVQTTSPPPVSSIPDIQPTLPPSPQIPSPSYHDTEGGRVLKKLENKLRKKRKSKEAKDAEGQDQEVPFETDQGDTFVTPEKSKGSGEAQEEQISPSTLEAAQILTNVASEGFKGSQAPLGSKIYKRKSKSTKTPTKILHFEEPDSAQVNTAQVNTAQVNTAELNPDIRAAEVNTVRAEGLKEKRKGAMTERGPSSWSSSIKDNPKELQELADLEEAKRVQG